MLERERERERERVGYSNSEKGVWVCLRSSSYHKSREGAGGYSCRQ